MKISKSILEAALGIVGQKIAPHSPQGNFVVDEVMAEAMSVTQKRQAETRLAQAKKELEDLDKKHGNSLRAPGTRRHSLHTFITNRRKAIDESELDVNESKEAEGHLWQADQHKKAAEKHPTNSKQWHAAMAAHHESKAEYYHQKGIRNLSDKHADKAEAHLMKMHEEVLDESEKYTDENGVTWNDEGDSDHGHTNWGRGPMNHYGARRYRSSGYKKPAAQKHYHAVPYKDKEHAKGEGMKWDGDKRKWYHTDAGKSATSKFKKLTEEEQLDEAVITVRDNMGDKSTLTGKKVGTNKEHGFTIHAGSAHYHRTGNSGPRHHVWVMHGDKLIASHSTHDEAEHKKAISHAKTATHFWSDKEKHKSFNLHNHDKPTVVKEENLDEEDPQRKFARASRQSSYAHLAPDFTNKAKYHDFAHKLATKLQKTHPHLDVVHEVDQKTNHVISNKTGEVFAYWDHKRNVGHEFSSSIRESLELDEAHSLESLRKMHQSEHENGGGTDASWAKMHAIRALVKKYHGKAAHDKTVKDTDDYAAHGGSGPARLKEEALDESKSQLPAGFKIVKHPRTGIKFVKHPNGALIPAQGSRRPSKYKDGDSEPDHEVISDFQIWYKKQGLKEEEKKGGFDHRKAAMAGVMHSDDAPHMKPNMQHDFYSSKNGDKIQGTVHTVTKDRVVMQANKQHHKDHGKFHTFKFAKSYDRMNEEAGDTSSRIREKPPVGKGNVKGHRFNVTVSDPDHTYASKRGEKIQKFINVSDEPDKLVAMHRAKRFYTKKGFRVHDVVHHSELHEGALTEEHATREQAEKRMADIEKKHPMAKHTVMQGRRSGKWHVVRHTSGGMHVVENVIDEDCGLESKADFNSKKQVGLATSGIDKDAPKKFASIVKSIVKPKKETK